MESVENEVKEKENKEKWDQIQALDLETIRYKFADKYIAKRSLDLQNNQGWWWNLWNDADEEAANEAEEAIPKIESEYRQFLYLLAINPGKCVVPWNQDLDDYWHAHILDTGKYAADCEKLFGRFVHHNPNLPKGTDEHSAAFNETKEMYKEAFKDRRYNYKSSAGCAAGCGVIFYPVFCYAYHPLNMMNPLNPMSPLNPLNPAYIAPVYTPPSCSSAPSCKSDDSPAPSAPSCSSAPASSCSSAPASSCSSGDSGGGSSSSCSSGSSCSGGSSCGGGGGGD